jgi:hypothetical protein
VVDAGGTTASTGSSVWLVKFGPKHVQWVWGQDGALLVPDPRIETIYDASSNPLTGYVQDMLARPGLQVGSIRSSVRIKKLTADSGKGLTDAVISLALAKFEVGVVPDVILMSRRSRQQLQASRTVTIMSGAGRQGRREDREHRAGSGIGIQHPDRRHRRDQGHGVSDALMRPCSDERVRKNTTRNTRLGDQWQTSI